MWKRIVVVLLIVVSPLLMAPQIVNNKAQTSAEAPLLCQWLPFLCRAR